MDEICVKSSKRLDQILSQELKISRNLATNLIKSGFVFLGDEAVIKPSFNAKNGDLIKIKTQIEQNLNFDLNFDIKVVYEDDEILVLNKPPNLATHGAKSLKEASLVDWLLDKNYKLSNVDSLGSDGIYRPGIVHRLDKGTSGAILVAKTDKSHINLKNQLLNRSMGRIYLTFLDLNLKQNLVVNRAIARNPKNRLKKIVSKDGRVAKTAFLKIDDELNLVAAKLFTGRTHQIRVHLLSLNRHILGDFLYGFKSANDKITHVMLHAYILYFFHPLSGEKIFLKADLYDDFLNLIDNSKNKEKIYEKILPNTLYNDFNSVDKWLCYN
ncbi:RluA family pseudouridine synthase [Campylobacter sp. FMV-PI01]|uniref:Pseudouridine synthase n=1 Tax=Campylobacter portucalensis TaxID=2608384 RepID=A0A6L5WJS3_9BACT|nr:RluA family pseudouridine synthase [Campylobacter portucalensis]MSN96497.1 RluA family pseudouridine synthase [Campylobacter portucalensis]